MDSEIKKINKTSVEMRDLRFSLQFNAEKESHLYVARKLKEKGRKKAAYIAETILFYEQMHASDNTEVQYSIDSTMDAALLPSQAHLISIDDSVQKKRNQRNDDKQSKPNQEKKTKTDKTTAKPTDENYAKINVEVVDNNELEEKGLDEHLAVDLSNNVDSDRDAEELIPVLSIDEDESEDIVELDLVLANLKLIGC